MNQSDWMSDPAVASISTVKLEFLQMLLFEGQKLSKEQMLPFLMSVAKKGKAENITFSNEEIDTIVSVLRKYATPEEVSKINKIMQLRR